MLGDDGRISISRKMACVWWRDEQFTESGRKDLIVRRNENSLEEPAFCGWKKEKTSAERVGSRIQELQWQILFNTLLPVLPALTMQLRHLAQEGEKAATEVGGQFLRIAEKIRESCGPLEKDGTSSRSAASTATSSEAVMQEISRIIVALQLQDAASQRLGNLAKVLDEIESVLSRWVSASPEHRQDVGELVSLAWAERIRSIRPDVTYTAKAPLSGHSTSTGAENGHASHSKVELF
jgi:hypothetical protein